MKGFLKEIFLIAFILLITISACRHVVLIESKTIIVSRTYDSTLNDSAMIYGLVYYAPDKKYVIPKANIWIEDINVKTISNDSGFYSLKIPPGKYTIRSFMENQNEEFVTVLKDLSISSNEKVEVNFLRGSRSE